eukprot:1922828-Prymnesium_polylepis.1
MKIPHPDDRPYPWLAIADLEEHAADSERYLIYQPFAGMCNQFSCLECAVGIARILGRTLVLPRWRPQYGWEWVGSSTDYFDVAELSKLVRCISLEQFVADFVRGGSGMAAPPRRAGEGVALCRLALDYNETWSNPRGFELYPALKSLLDDLEYFATLEAQQGAALGLVPAVD